MSADYLAFYKNYTTSILAKQSVWHCAEAMRLLSEELNYQNDETHLDSRIVVIVTLAIRARLRGEIQESLVHMLGLKKVINSVAGGLPALERQNPEVGIKIRRCDVELSLYTGTLTINSGRLLPSLAQFVPINQVSEAFPLPSPINKSSTIIMCSMRDALALCHYAGSSHFEAPRYHDIILSIFERLVDFCPLNGARPVNFIDDVCQLGLIAFMVTIAPFHKNFSNFSLPYGLLKSRLSIEHLFEDIHTHTTQLDLPFYLWLTMFLSMPSATSTQDQAAQPDIHAIQIVQYFSRSMDVKAWEDARVYLSLYPWIPEYHDTWGKTLWDQALSM